MQLPQLVESDAQVTLFLPWNWSNRNHVSKAAFNLLLSFRFKLVLTRIVHLLDFVHSKFQLEELDSGV